MGKSATILKVQKRIGFTCLQVGSKPFRIYRHLFRDGFVNGQMLLSVTNDILEQMKITNIWHRQSILFAVGKLREASDQLSAGRSENLGEVASPDIIESMVYFVISYFLTLYSSKFGLFLHSDGKTGDGSSYLRHFRFLSKERRI